MHLDDATIQSLLIDEPTPESAGARAHLAACEECGSRFAAAERESEEIAELLRNLDPPTPAVTLEAVRARAQRAEPARRAQSSIASRSHAHRGWRWAAAILIALGVLRGAYAMPGSPLPKWVASVVELVTKPERPVPRPDAIPHPLGERLPTPAPSETALSGIAVIPGPSLLILFRQPAGEGEIQVALTDGSDVEVRAPSGAATFTSSADRILIDHPTSAAVFEVSIPRAEPRVEIQVDGRRVFLKDGTQVTTATPTGAGATYVLPLISSP